MRDVTLRVLTALVFFGYFAHRFFYLRKVRHVPGAIARAPREPGGPILLLFISAIVVTVCAAAPGALRWAALPLSGRLRWSGLPCAVAAFGLLEWAQAALGRNWSLRVQVLKEHELVIRGPYRWVRHPMYLAGLLASVSVLLLSGNALVGGTWLAMHSWQFALRIPLEERLMTEQFGDTYLAYVRTTGRLIPRIHRGG